MSLGVHLEIDFGSFNITIVSFSYTLEVYLDWFLPASAPRLRKLLNIIKYNMTLNDSNYEAILNFILSAIDDKRTEANSPAEFKKLASNEKIIRGELDKWLQ